MPLSTERIAAIGLGAAALAIVALAALVFTDVARETDLNRSTMAQQAVQDSLERLRTEMLKAKYASYGFALTGRESLDAQYGKAHVEVEAELQYLKGQNFPDPQQHNAIAAVAARAHAHLLFARQLIDVRREKGAAAAVALGQNPEAERIEQAALGAVQDALRRQNDSLAAMALQQIRYGEGLRRSVMWLMGGAIAFLLGVFFALSYAQVRRREVEARIRFLAHHDPLTQLPNRSLLSDRLEQQLAISGRGGGVFSVIAFDLDGFKGVNDSLGHSAGDRLLEEVARRSRHALRASDTVGRLGGDEFLVILPDTGCEGAQALCGKLLAELAKPYRLGRESVEVSASAGIACHPVHGREADSLLSGADAALYEAKRAGKNRFSVVSETSFAALDSA